MLTLEKSRKNALIIAGLYALFAGCWILFSDIAVESFVAHSSEITWLQTAKGWLFVLITALCLYLAINYFSQKIEQAFKLDGMTGLLSHDLFKVQLTKLINGRKEDDKIVVGILDINNFKEINSHYGFEAADQLVKELARAFLSYINPNSLLCRLPPDQFMVARNITDASDFESRLAGYVKLSSQIARDLGIEATFTIGVAFCPIDGSSAKHIMDAAVDALRSAKKSGVAVQYHDRALAEKIQARRELVEQLKTAIDQDALSLVYQPKYVLNTQAVSGIEVLVRWNHPDRGFISPGEFVPLAEEYGLTHAISRFVIRKAAAELIPAGILGSRIKHVAINVSAAEFNNLRDMDELLICIQEQTQLANYLRIEITETATLTDIKQSSAIILRLRNEGLSISIDDFGTGYTSLAMLKDLTVDELKIDRSFVSNLGEDGRSTTIVAAIIGMARSFGINVVAEGVETEGQLNILRVMECDEVQGYLLGKPMNITALKTHLRESAPRHSDSRQ